MQKSRHPLSISGPRARVVIEAVGDIEVDDKVVPSERDSRQTEEKDTKEAGGLARARALSSYSHRLVSGRRGGPGGEGDRTLDGGGNFLTGPHGLG